METVTSLALAIDAKDPYTQGHSPKVANYAALIAEGFGLKEHDIEQVRLGGMLHDLGKVGVSEAILNKAGRSIPRNGN
jgi:HD-GYP domain-containing protein (c-di-GMP phosphodiesterase class II)